MIGLTGDWPSSSLTLLLIEHFESCVGFQYNFDSLHSPDDRQDDLYGAICDSLKANLSSNKIIFTLQALFPIFRRIVSTTTLLPQLKVKKLCVTLLQPTNRSRVLDREFESVRRIGSELVEEKKNAVLAECNVDGSGSIGKEDVRGHDLLSLLIKSNITSDMPEHMRMSDSEMLSRESHFSSPSS